MSKIESLKNQYPNLNLNLLDLAKRLDPTKSHKYVPVICKILNQKFKLFCESVERDNEIKELVTERGVNIQGLSMNDIYVLYTFLDMYSNENIELIQDLVNFGERNLLQTKDILTYKNIQEIKNDISLAYLKFNDKEYANQIYKEFEDETWLALRPLTFESSIKYGAATKWCTTYKSEKQYFARYWNRGVLVYFINKKTGYKFAGYKNTIDKDLSFWNAADSRIDSLEIDCESYLYDIIKNIFKSEKPNSEYCDSSMVLKVCMDCGYVMEKYEPEPVPYPDLDGIQNLIETNTALRIPREEYVVSTTYQQHENFEYPDEEVPNMRA